MSKEKRDDGFYKVKDPTGNWTIAEWENEKWYIIGHQYCLDDDDFEEIEENKISMPL